MADLGLGIVGVVGTVHVCIKAGKLLVQAYKDYGQADVMINELSVRIQLSWSRITAQLLIIEKLESGMTDEQRELQSQVLHILQSKLEAATVVISKPDKHSTSRRIKGLHFLNLRESLESTVADLEAWQQRFEPSWFQVVKTGAPAVDGVLRNVAQIRSRDHEEPAREALRFRRSFDDPRTVILADKVLEDLDGKAILYCKAHMAIERKEGKCYIIDTVSQETVKLRHARELASRLRDSNHFIFGTLKCKGTVRLQESSLAFVFRVPEGHSTVHSCRELLLSGRIPDSLTRRLKIARQLVTAVYYVHLYEFVHKNIAPETILTLQPSEEGTDKMVVCLVGFQLIRYADAQTNTSKLDRKGTVYQHPSRAGDAAVTFVMQHDIYSLGVCLLEIGLWQSLINYDIGDATQISETLQITEGTPEHLSPEAIKEQLISLSRKQLRATMGDVYSKVVETCLTCLDEGNTEFGDPRDFEDEDGVEVGSRYVKKIMDAMGSICY
ncbi:hypothetical protein FSARC_11850 [Fusarium sarcochroum]|uniref:Protein kinase domain-containing protein n=1 Tax=Fusarium sarcochroum TaxID=1208366 RepID=A0A8H4TCJ8_9HYPO|nr:hypothetical protein FSARC_11850 [Fusarium sarcochroum]